MRIAAMTSALSIATMAFASEPWMDKSIAALHEEPKIVEVLFNQDSAQSLWISVQDDGTRRDGFAEYACVILHDSGMPIGGFTVIHIYDAKFMAAGEMNEIGRFDCAHTE